MGKIGRYFFGGTRYSRYCYWWSYPMPYVHVEPASQQDEAVDINRGAEVLAAALREVSHYRAKDWMTKRERTAAEWNRHKKLYIAAAGLAVSAAFVETGAADMVAEGVEGGYQAIVDGLAGLASHEYSMGVSGTSSPTDISLTPENKELTVIWAASGENAGSIE